ncbi:MAG: OsmC family protein [Deltaproteobacteria bacterium]|nr:OsmC family protein [Deltaproteobacteria bacterium]
MKVKVTQKDGFHFIGSGAEYPGELPIDAAAHVGGKGRGFRPPELLMYSIAGCMGIHSREALLKAGKQIEDLTVETDGERAGEDPKWFTQITLQFSVKGRGVTERDVREAIDVALHKTCSIAALIHRVAPISCEVRML